MAVSQTLSVTEVSRDYASNTSQVRILWKSTQSGESWNGYTRTAKYYVSINGGAETEYSVSYTLPQNSTNTIVDTTITVTRKGNGTATVKVRTWMDTGISAGVVEKSETLSISSIRQAFIKSASDIRLGESCAVTWELPHGSLAYKLNFSIGSWSYTTPAIKVPSISGSDYTYTGYTLPMDVANQLPNAATGQMKVTLATYTSIACIMQVGEDHSVYITVTVPNDATTQPTVSMSLAPSSTLPSPFNEWYIQGLSKVKVELEITTKFGASIKSSLFGTQGSYYQNRDESNILTRSGSSEVWCQVTDSRGYTARTSRDIEVMPYSKPYVCPKSGEVSIIAARCDNSANLTDSGTYLKIKAKVAVSKLIYNGAQTNYGYIKFRYRKEGGTYSSWQTILDGKTNNSDEVITPPLLNGALDTQSNYQVQIIASDAFHDSVPVTIAIPSEAVYMDRPAGGKSMGLGGYSSGDGNLDVHWKTKARGGLSMFDAKGDEIPLDSTLPLPRGQVNEGWNPNNLENGAYVVTNSKPLKSGDTVIMYNGVLIQMNGTVDGTVKIQLALTSDENKNPFYRAYWYGNWGNWRSFKL
jgi:hypothetical protein